MTTSALQAAAVKQILFRYQATVYIEILTGAAFQAKSTKV